MAPAYINEVIRRRLTLLALCMCIKNSVVVQLLIGRFMQAL